MKTVKVAYGGFHTEQEVDECLYNAIYNKAISDIENKVYEIEWESEIDEHSIKTILEQIKEQKNE